jgi:hypothetical protein
MVTKFHFFFSISSSLSPSFNLLSSFEQKQICRSWFVSTAAALLSCLDRSPPPATASAPFTAASRGSRGRGTVASDSAPLRRALCWRPATACFLVAAITSRGVRGYCCGSCRSPARRRRAAPGEGRSCQSRPMGERGSVPLDVPRRWPALLHVRTGRRGVDFDRRRGWAGALVEAWYYEGISS